MIIQKTNVSLASLAAKQVGGDAPRVAVANAKPAPPQEAPSSQQVQGAVGTINQALQLSHHNLRFSVDPDTKKSVVQVVDTETGDLIRQMPSKEALAIANSIDQFLQRGALLRQEV